MAFLAWSILEIQQGYTRAGVYDQVVDTLVHGTEYLIKCHRSPGEFVVQVGNPADYVVDLQRGSGSWGLPQDMPPDR